MTARVFVSVALPCYCASIIALNGCIRDDRHAYAVAPIYVDDAICNDCTLRAMELGTVGNDSLTPTLGATLATDGDSLIAVTPLQGRLTIGLFSFAGVFRRQVPLPEGWKAVSLLQFTDNGRLAMMSDQRDHIVELSPDGRVRRMLTVPRNTHRFLMAGRDVIVNAELRTADGLGFPLHTLSGAGNLQRSFGARDETVIPRTINSWRRRIAPSSSGATWSANPDAYSLELWDSGGVLLRRIERRSAWWDSVSSGSDPANFATAKPRAEVIGIWEDSRGLLWTQVKVASRQWRALSPEEMARRHDSPFRLSEYDEFFDTVIEVIDPDSGRIVATARFPGAFNMLLRGQVLAKWVETGSGSYVLRLLRLSLPVRATARAFAPSLSFPRKLESSVVLLDSSFRGNDNSVSQPLSG